MHAAELSLQSAAAILKIRNETTAIQEEGGSAVASFTGIFARGAAGQHPQRQHGPVLRGQHGRHGRS